VKYYTIGEFSKLVGKSIPTLHLWDKKDKLKPHHVSEGGHRYYSDEQIYSVLKMNVNHEERKIIGYCRIPTGSQEDDLKNQIDTIKTYMISKGYSFKVISDVGNGYDFCKKGLENLLGLIIQGKVEKLVVLNKYILSSCSLEFIVDLCRKFNTVIEIIDKSEEINEYDLLMDLKDMLSCHAKKLSSNKSGKAKKLFNNFISEIENVDYASLKSIKSF
jgi:putative resolvase